MPFSLRSTILIIICLYLVPGLYARQPDDGKPLRIEIPVKSDNETYRVIPCGNSGVLIFFKSLETVQDTLTRWYFSYYDKDLDSKWIKALPIRDVLEYRSGIFSRDTLYLLYQPSEKEKNRDFIILRIALKAPVFRAIPGKMPRFARTSGFLVGFGKSLIGYQAGDNSAVLQFLDLETGEAKFTKLTGDTSSFISDMAIDTSAREFLVVYREEITKTGSEFFMNRYQDSGKKISDVLLSTLSPDREIRRVKIFPSQDGKVLIFGTYGSRVRSKSGSKKDAITESTGFYFTRVSQFKQETVNFINFLDLKNSSNLLAERDVMSLKKKSLKKGRDIREFSVDFNILLHPVIPEDDQFLFLVETYFPEYHSENFTDFDFYGQPFINTYNVFDGYRFTNAIIAGFSPDGKLKWDNTMEIRNLLSFQLDPKVQVYINGSNVVLAYQSEGKIGSKIISGEDVVEKLDFSSIEMLSENDKLISETKSRLLLWYEDYFLSYGYEEIKNIVSGDKRMVFYLSKIQFR